MMRGMFRASFPWRLLGVAATVVFGALFVAVWAMWIMNDPPNVWGGDFVIYRDATERWLSGGSYYLDRQLHGPYEIVHGDVLYPPTTIPLFIPFLWLPAILWWVIPLGIVAAVVAWHHPHPLAWAAIAACVWFPFTGTKLIYGNPSMWVAAAIALGTVWRWPAALVLLKPTLAPFALIGIHRRSWWVTVAAMVGISLVFLPLWADAIRVLVDSRNPKGLLYSAAEIPMVVIPVIAWIGGRYSPLPALRRRVGSAPGSELAPEPARTNG
jgi:hypothetical protein